MNAIIEKINRALEEAAAKAAAASAADAVEQIRIDYLGRHGLFPALSKEMGSGAPEERKETGRAFNEGRTRIQALIDEAQAEAEALRDAIKAAMGSQEAVQAGEYRITWKPVTSSRLDATALRKALPDVAERFTRTTTTRRFCVA